MASFNALVRMLELRLERQQKSVLETMEQLNAAKLAAHGPPSKQADLLADSEPAKRK